MPKQSEQTQSKTEKKDKLIRIEQALELVPVSRSNWWAGCKSGRYPQPIRLGRVTCWLESEVLALMQRSTSDNPRPGKEEK